MGKNEIPTGRKLWECINPFVFLVVCIFVCTAAVTGGIMAFSRGAGESTAQMYARAAGATLYCDLAFYAVTLAAKYKSARYDKFRYGHHSNHWPMWKIIAASAGAVAACYVLDLLLTLVRLPERFPEYTTSAEASFSGQPVFWLVLVVVVLGPLAEEMIFRWMIFGRIRYYFGSRWAILVSALLFGLYHGTVVQFIYCTCMGLIFAWLYDKSGCIWIPVAAHMANNFLAVLTYF